MALAEAAKQDLKDASRFLVFNESGTVLASNFTANAAELKPLTVLYNDRDDAIRHAMFLQGTRYEVHRYHPPLIYGRTMGGVPEQSEGCAMCRVEGPSGVMYGVITYQMPNISARMVPLLQKFCEDHLRK